LTRSLVSFSTGATGCTKMFHLYLLCNISSTEM
jgi:hypothetical protein